MDITFEFGSLRIDASLNDTSAAQVIYSTLPITGKVNHWGDEIYFEIPVKLTPEKTTMDLKVGDIGYWPQGTCLCLFFGKTPASIDERPRPASEVAVVGTFRAAPELLRTVASGTKVRILKH